MGCGMRLLLWRVRLQLGIGRRRVTKDPNSAAGMNREGSILAGRSRNSGTEDVVNKQLNHHLLMTLGLYYLSERLEID